MQITTNDQTVTQENETHLSLQQLDDTLSRHHWAENDEILRIERHTKLLHTLGNGVECPSCQAKSVRRLKRSFYERWLTDQHKFQCKSCQHRFYAKQDMTEILPL